jgi:hypothetical protein
LGGTPPRLTPRPHGMGQPRANPPPPFAPRHRSPLKRMLSPPCPPFSLPPRFPSFLSQSKPHRTPCLVIQPPTPEQDATGSIATTPALSSPPPVNAASVARFPLPHHALTIFSISYRCRVSLPPLRLSDPATTS